MDLYGAKLPEYIIVLFTTTYTKSKCEIFEWSSLA